jgi:hypothetical protein
MDKLIASTALGIITIGALLYSQRKTENSIAGVDDIQEPAPHDGDDNENGGEDILINDEVRGNDLDQDFALSYCQAGSHTVEGESAYVKLYLEGLHPPDPIKNYQGFYDFILPFETISSIEVGWPLTFSPEASEYLGDYGYNFENLQTVGILGYYSKGKSFLLNHLYKSALGSQEHHRVAKEGPSVTTRGLSGVFLSKEGSVKKANLLVIDTAGRNAPASRQVGHDLPKTINEIRAKEKLIDDVITQIADTIIYVVDEVLNEDQRAILHLVGNISERGKRLILVHNFKRIDARDCEEHIQEQIVKPFGASLYHPEKSQVWRSEYPIESNPKLNYPVIHVSLFNQSTSGEYNAETFTFIYSVISSPPLQAYPHNPIDRICRSIADCLPSVVKFIDPSDETNSQFLQLPTCSPENLLSPSILIHLEPRKRVQLLSWELISVPTRYAPGWKPNHTSTKYHIDSDPKRRAYYARIDLPGLNESHRVEQPPANSEKSQKNWWCLEVDKFKDEADQSYCVSGYREIINPCDDQEVFGEFKIEFLLPHYYDHVVCELRDSTFIINGTKKEKEMISGHP